MNWNRKFPRFALTIMAIVACADATSGAVRYVAQGGQTPATGYLAWNTAATNIQDALDASDANDTIIVSNGVYDTGGVLAGAQINRVLINKRGITLQAASTNPADTLIVGGGTLTEDPVRCVCVSNDLVTISGFTITNGYAAGNGGGVYSEAWNLTISNCTVVGSHASQRGGGIYIHYRTATVNDCLIKDNEAGDEGGGMGTWPGTVTTYDCYLNDSRVVGNRAGTSGGGVSRVFATRCEIVGNTAASAGGANYCTVTGSIVSNNVATTGAGGGLNNNKRPVSDTLICSNRAATVGGGVFYAIVTDCTIVNNDAGTDGGGLADCMVFDSLVASNRAAANGGGLSTTASQALAYSSNTVFRANHGKSGGGQNGGSSIDCVFSNNVAMFQGGGANSVNVTDCLLVGNIATNGNGYGGGMRVGSAERCRFLNNTALYGGAALQTTPMRNCLMTGNHALKSSSAVNGTSVLLSCTVVGNTTAKGSYAFHAVAATNCIVWGNTALDTGNLNNYQVGSAIQLFAYSCTTPLPSGVQDLGGNIAQEPLLADMAAGDYSLRPASPCINRGLNLAGMAEWRDLAGQPRIFPAGGTVDIGAFERIPADTVTIMLLR